MTANGDEEWEKHVIRQGDGGSERPKRWRNKLHAILMYSININVQDKNGYFTFYERSSMSTYLGSSVVRQLRLIGRTSLLHFYWRRLSVSLLIENP